LPLAINHIVFVFCILNFELPGYHRFADNLTGDLDMLIAQGLGEYGALASGGSSGLRDLLGNIEYTMRDADSSVWLAVLFGMVVLWFVFLRK
jgi:hypothetical protein